MNELVTTRSANPGRKIGMPSMKSIFATLTLAVASISGAQASVIYASRAAFEAAVNIAYTEDFETLGPGTVTFPGPIVLPTGLGVSSASNDLFSPAPGQSTNPTQGIGSNTPVSDSLNFDLGGDFLSFGGDFFQNNGGGIQFGAPILFQLSFFDDGGLVDQIVGSVAPNGGSFIGFTADAVFDRVEVLATPTPAFEVADDISVGDPSAVPEPASILLIGFGLIGLGLSRKRKG